MGKNQIQQRNQSRACVPDFCAGVYCGACRVYDEFYCSAIQNDF